MGWVLRYCVWVSDGVNAVGLVWAGRQVKRVVCGKTWVNARDVVGVGEVRSYSCCFFCLFT